MSYFTVKEEQQKMFTQLPKALLYEEKYKLMSNDSKVLYSFLIDRVSLSMKNGYVDELGRVYIKCSEITMAEILNKSEKTVRKFKKELIEKDLLEQVDVKNDKTMYYVKQPQVTVSKLEDYIADFQEVVKEKTQKELERNKEYRMRKAENKVAYFNDQNCNGKNDRSIENTSFQDEKSLNPLEMLATVESTVVQREKLPYSNTNISNTDFSMYVCTDEPTETEIELLRRRYEEENYKMLTLVRKHGLLVTEYFENFLKELEDDNFDYELFEQVLYNAINKRVNNLEGYVFRTINNLKAKGVTNRYEYDLDVELYVAKNYRNGRLLVGKDNRQTNTNKATTPVEPKEQPKFVPLEDIEVPEVKAPKQDFKLNERVECLNFRKANNLMDSKYFEMNLEQLKAVVAEREEKERQVETLMETYNKDFFDAETRRKFAMQALGLI